MTVPELNQRVADIYDQTFRDVYRYVLSQCRAISDVPDIVQNTYLRLCRRMEKGGEIRQIKPYLFKIARHEIYKVYGLSGMALNHIPVFSRREGESFEDIEAELAAETDIDSTLLCDELWEYIKNTDTLTYKIFILYFQWDEKLCDIAKTLHISESTVKNRLFRTLRKMRETFKL